MVLPLVPERGAGALPNTERWAAFGALLFAAVQYPFSSQELVVDSELLSLFPCAFIHFAFLNYLALMFSLRPNARRPGAALGGVQ